MHSSYYYRAHACIMVFDVTRKVTYKNLEKWYDELQDNCKGIPTLVVANKIDIDYKVCRAAGKSGISGAESRAGIRLVGRLELTGVAWERVMRLRIAIPLEASATIQPHTVQRINRSLKLPKEVGLRAVSRGAFHSG